MKPRPYSHWLILLVFLLEAVVSSSPLAAPSSDGSSHLGDAERVWMASSDFAPPVSGSIFGDILSALHERGRAHPGVKPVITVDLDDTVFDARYGAASVFKDWLKSGSPGSQILRTALRYFEARPQALPGSDPEEIFSTLGLPRDSKDYDRFSSYFWNEVTGPKYPAKMSHTFPGVVARLKQFSEAGARIIYLSSKSEAKQGTATRALIRKFGLPLASDSDVILKTSEISGAEFRKREFSKLASEQDVVAAIDNSPTNLQAIQSVAGKNTKVVLFSSHFEGIPQTPGKGLYEVSSWQQSAGGGLPKKAAAFSPPPERYREYAARIRAGGELTPFPELKTYVRQLEAVLASPEMESAIDRDPALRQFREQVQNSLFHIDLRFKSEITEGAYKIPFKEPFPYRPTLAALAEGQDFIRLVNQVTGRSFQSGFDPVDGQSAGSWASLVDALPSRHPRPELAAQVPLSASLESSERTSTQVRFSAEEHLIDDPVNEYERYHARLLREGENASFPEFRDTVDQLLGDLSAPDTIRSAKESRALGLARARILSQLRSVGSEKSYPYRETIDSVIGALKFFDAVERTKYAEKPDSRAVENSWIHGPKENRLVEPPYHYDRYMYHWFSVISDPNALVFPTAKSLEWQDLVKVRSVPVGFIGVAARTVFADRHYQTPLDFWYHDVNHVRRMLGYMNAYMEKAGAKTEPAKRAVYQAMSDLIAKVNAATEPLPRPDDPTKILAWEKEIARRKITRAIFFESLHESAVTADRESIVTDLLRTPETPQPFEYQTMGDDAVSDIEILRTSSGNVASGARRLRQLKGDEAIHIHYFKDRALSLLSNVVNKLTHNFYDSAYSPNDDFVPVKYRTPEAVTDAAEALFGILGEKAPPHETLLSWASSKSGSPEKYSAYQNIADAVAAKPAQRVAITATAEEVKRSFKESGKKVVTFIGYSGAEYEDPARMLAVARETLLKFDPNKTIVNIGATSEGIGRVYPLAKKMGFETRGIVSSLAKQYGGLSPAVDHAYYVEDTEWGGFSKDGLRLTPTSEAMIGVSDVVIGIGGNEIGRDEMRVARRRGKLLQFTAADMNHEIAIQKAVKKGAPLPKDFRGAASVALGGDYLADCLRIHISAGNVKCGLERLLLGLFGRISRDQAHELIETPFMLA